MIGVCLLIVKTMFLKYFTSTIKHYRLFELFIVIKEETACCINFLAIISLNRDLPCDLGIKWGL